MKLIPMIATADFDWKGIPRTAGQRLEVLPVEAAALKYQERARFILGSDTQPPSPPDLPDEHQERPRQEDPVLDEERLDAPLADVDPAPSIESAPGQKTRRPRGRPRKTRETDPQHTA